MYKTRIITFAVIIATLHTACNNKVSFDASGSFEADERIISAEQTGKILTLNIEEGQVLDSNQLIGQIDVTGLNLEKAVTQATISSIKSKVNEVQPQVSVLRSQAAAQQQQVLALNRQLDVLNKEIRRTENLVKGDAVPAKQLDDLIGQRSVMQKQIAAASEQVNVLNRQITLARSNIGTQNRSILSEINPTEKKITQIDDKINRGRIINIYPGTILTKYAMAGEFTSIGKPLYKIADLSNITLRAYITGDQLPQIKLNQKVKVLTDDGKDGYKETQGTISWISDKAEFTPKTIQTKNERANMVYAIKVKVKNDGSYKIGMYGEIKFQ